MASRRIFLQVSLLCGLGCAASRLLADEASGPQSKANKAKVHYQDSPKDVRSCGTCSYFAAPKACTVMEGEVSKHGFCDLYTMID